MDPTSGFAQAASTSSPTQSDRNVTFLPKSSSSFVAIGLKVNFGFFVPSGRPRCDMSTIDLAPFWRAKLMVGKAARIL